MSRFVLKLGGDPELAQAVLEPFARRRRSVGMLDVELAGDSGNPGRTGYS